MSELTWQVRKRDGKRVMMELWEGLWPTGITYWHDGPVRLVAVESGHGEESRPSKRADRKDQ